MPQPRRLVPALLLAVCLEALPAAAGVEVGPWRPLFHGIELAEGRSDDGIRLEVRVLRIDPGDPDLALHATPDNGEAPLETTSQTTRDFLRDHGLQVAVNANFFSPCCNIVPEPKDLLGVAVSGGRVVSPPDTSGLADALLVRATGLTLERVDDPADLDEVLTAVAGHAILRHGVNLGDDGARHPRTAVGLTPGGTQLLLLTIDGRQPGWSDGATLRETADWLVRFGALDGVNLDGGGSTTMAMEDPSGPLLLNRPVGVLNVPMTERLNGNNLGAFAARLAPPWCAPRPRRGCPTESAGAETTLRLRNGALGRPARIGWRWHGEASTLSAVAPDDVDGAVLRLCLWTAGTGADDPELLFGTRLVLDTDCGDGSCRVPTALGWRYRDPQGTHGAVRRLEVTADAPMGASLRLAARGRTVGRGNRFPNAPLILQLQREGGSAAACLETRFPAGGSRRRGT